MWGFLQPFSWASDKAFQQVKLKTLDRIHTIWYRHLIDTDWSAYRKENLWMQRTASPNPKAQPSGGLRTLPVLPKGSIASGH